MIVDLDAIFAELRSHPRMQAAIAEMEETIRRHYPDATFSVHTGDDPFGVYLIATVDVDDTDEVMDLVIDRIVDLHIEGVPLHVLPVRTPEREAKMLAEQAQQAPATVLD